MREITEEHHKEFLNFIIIVLKSCLLSLGETTFY